MMPSTQLPVRWLQNRSLPLVVGLCSGALAFLLAWLVIDVSHTKARTEIAAQAQRPHLKTEWVKVSPRSGVKGGRSPAQRTLDAWDREVRWSMAGRGALPRSAMETQAAAV